MSGFYSKPSQLDIVYGLFPYPPNFAQPGPEPHYCLVLDVFEDEDKNPWVLVAFGTSKNTDKLYSGEFLVRPHHAPNDGSGLEKPTKFSLARNRLAKLPYNDTFFSVPPSRRASGQTDPSIGVLNKGTYGRKLEAAAKGANAAASVTELMALDLGMLPN